MLSNADIASMRSVAEQALPGTCVLYTGGTVSDGGGGYTEGFTVAGTVSCRCAPLTASEDLEGGRISPDADWMFTLPALTSIAETSRIVHNGGTFSVEAIRGPRSYEITRRVEARKNT